MEKETHIYQMNSLELNKKFAASAIVARLSGNNSGRKSRAAQVVFDRLKETENNFEDLISSRVKSSEPFLFGRLGGVEANALGIFLSESAGIRDPFSYLGAKLIKRRRLNQLCNNAGVYPTNQKEFRLFCQEHLTSLQSMDAFSVWAKPFAWVESSFVSNPNLIVVNGDASYPWLESRDGNSRFGWGQALDKMKVLVISPFHKSMLIQSRKLQSLFCGLDIPDMKLTFLTSPMSQGGLMDGNSYSYHLNRMKENIEKEDFDICLVSAGAYSLPLAAHAKKLGKKGVHAGGALQIFFGITGNRYDTYPGVIKFKNQNWKRPSSDERPENWQSIEDGCYW
jgi:hypothetical protein